MEYIVEYHISAPNAATLTQLADRIDEVADATVEILHADALWLAATTNTQAAAEAVQQLVDNHNCTHHC